MVKYIYVEFDMFTWSEFKNFFILD